MCARFIVSGAAGLALFGMSTAVEAGSVNIAPVRIEFTDKAKIQVVTVRNPGTEPVRGQLRVYSWHQVDGQEVLEEAPDVLVNPASFELPPGGMQIARLGTRGTQGAVEQAYRLIFDQVPNDRAPAPGEVRTLIRIVIPVFIPPVTNEPLLGWSSSVQGQTATLILHNGGNAHVQVHRISLVMPDGTHLADKDVSTYLLARTERAFTVELVQPVPTGQVLALHALTDTSAAPIIVRRDENALVPPRP